MRTDFEESKLGQIIDSQTLSVNEYFPQLSLVHIHSDIKQSNLLEYINENIIGKHFLIQGPWGVRQSRVENKKDLVSI